MSIVIVAVILILVIPLWNEKKEIGEVCFYSTCLKVEVVETREAMMKGLMYRESLGKYEGMLFLYQEEGLHSFWMKNMNFPIDIIWIAQDMKIVYILEEVPPCKTDICPIYKPDEQAQYILEVNANFSRDHGIEVGDETEFIIK